MADTKTIPQIIEEVSAEICDKYCKYPNEWKPEDHDGKELFESDICANCPLMKLG